MTGLMQRIFRRRSSGSPSRGATGLVRRLPAILRLRRDRAARPPWGRAAEQRQLPPGEPVTEPTEVVVEQVAGDGTVGFRERGNLRRRLRFLRRARELAFRDVGGLIFDLRRFGRERPDLVEAKLDALAAVDRELRALERVLDDRRPLHELREPGITSCARCGALHASEANFCPHCGLQIGGPRAMGEVGGAIAAPPQAPSLPAAAAAPSPEQPHAEPGDEQVATAPKPDPPAASRSTQRLLPERHADES